MIKQDSIFGYGFRIEGSLKRADGSEEEGVFEIDLKEGGDGEGGDIEGSGNRRGSSGDVGSGGGTSGTLSMIGLNSLCSSSFLWMALSMKNRSFQLFEMNSFSERESRLRFRNSATLVSNPANYNLERIAEMGAPLSNRLASPNPNLTSSSSFGASALPTTRTLFKLAKKVFLESELPFEYLILPSPNCSILFF